MRKLESGSAHIIIVVVIVLGIIGGLGYLFYVNIINKNHSDTSPAIVTKTNDGEISSVKKISYCTQYEKICFEYPDTWTVKQEKVSGENRDALSLTAPGDVVALVFESGIGAFDVCCGPMPEGVVEVVSATRATKFGENTYVSEVVTPKVDGEYPDPSQPIVKSVVKGYIPQLVLHHSASLSKQDRFTRTNGSIIADAVMNGKYAMVDDNNQNHGSVLFGTVNFRITSDLKVYTTSEEAKKQFNTKSYQQAKEILLSANYK